MGMGKMGMKLG